jgi:MFS superfamily sulfate permease-like transporter
LSLSNSVIATHQTVKDLFPDSEVSLKKIGFSYTIANMIMPFFSGIPVCHGCGGLAGHYSLGGRTGGSVIIYGLMYLIIGLFFSAVFSQVVAVFPLPILGIVLLFEALTLLLFMADQSASQQNLMIAFLVAVIAFSVPQGYLIGLVIGTLIYYGKKVDMKKL